MTETHREHSKSSPSVHIYRWESLAYEKPISWTILRSFERMITDYHFRYALPSENEYLLLMNYFAEFVEIYKIYIDLQTFAALQVENSG